MHLEEMKREIENLVVTKGFYNKPEDIPKKLLFAFIELGEASDAWKKGEAEEEIASAANQPISDFVSEIENKTPYHYEMKKTAEDGKCVFLMRNRCIIYSKRPLICRFYPFGLTTTGQQKTFYYTKECPGIGKGETLREEDFQILLRQANKRNRIGRG